MLHSQVLLLRLVRRKFNVSCIFLKLQLNKTLLSRNFDESFHGLRAFERSHEQTRVGTPRPESSLCCSYALDLSLIGFLVGLFTPASSGFQIEGFLDVQFVLCCRKCCRCRCLWPNVGAYETLCGCSWLDGHVNVHFPGCNKTIGG